MFYSYIFVIDCMCLCCVSVFLSLICLDTHLLWGKLFSACAGNADDNFSDCVCFSVHVRLCVLVVATSHAREASRNFASP